MPTSGDALRNREAKRTNQPYTISREGLADVRIVVAIYDSAKTKRAVELPELPIKKRPTTGREIHRHAHGKPKTVNTKPPPGEAA